MKNMEMMKKNIRRYGQWLCGVSAVLLLLMLCMAGCKSAQKSLSGSAGIEQEHYLSSKVQLTVPTKDAVLTVNGTMKLVSGERLQLSFLMPILRTEVARVEITPDDVLLIDRMGKRYVKATRQELKAYLPKKADFTYLEKLLFAAAQPDGKRVLTGKELGIASLEKGKMELYGFSTEPLTLVPAQLSSKYKEVTLQEMLHLLMSL